MATGNDEPSPARRLDRAPQVASFLIEMISGRGLGGPDEKRLHARIDHKLTLFALVEADPFENFNHPADLHAFGQITRERCASLGDGFVGTCNHLEFPRISRSG
jgi:hypothetical protein